MDGYHYKQYGELSSLHYLHYSRVSPFIVICFTARAISPHALETAILRMVVAPCRDHAFGKIQEGPFLERSAADIAVASKSASKVDYTSVLHDIGWPDCQFHWPDPVFIQGANLCTLLPPVIVFPIFPSRLF